MSLVPAAGEQASKESDDVPDLNLQSSEGPAVHRAEPANDEAIMAKDAPRPVGAYAHARRHGNLLFLAGVGPRSPKDNAIPGNAYDSLGNVIAYDAELQIKAVIENVKNILESVGIEPREGDRRDGLPHRHEARLPYLQSRLRGDVPEDPGDADDGGGARLADTDRCGVQGRGAV